MNKGIEYLTEIIFFYGLLLGVGFYELSLAMKEANIKKEKTTKVEKALANNLNKLETLRSNLDQNMLHINYNRE
jgi:hypothetical protein